MLPPALAIAALGALESLLSATVADGMSVNQHHDPDKELFGQGLANLAAPVFGGIPATGADRPHRRQRPRRRDRRSSRRSCTRSILAVIVFTAGPLVALIPLAALAGVLFATAAQMVQSASLLALARSTRGDAAVLALTFAVTVAVDLVTAVTVGVGVAALLRAAQAAAASATLDEVPAARPPTTDAEERALLAEHIVAFRLEGSLVFAAAHRFLLELSEVAQVRVVILRMARVTTLDATGALACSATRSRTSSGRGIIVLLSGVASDHEEVLSALGVADDLRRDGRLFATTPEAIEHARAIVHARDGSAPRLGAPAVA